MAPSAPPRTLGWATGLSPSRWAISMPMATTIWPPPISMSDSVSILLGQGDGTFRRRPGLCAGRGPSSVTVGDFNGDGHHDLATAIWADTVSILLGQGDGTFQAAPDFGVGADLVPSRWATSTAMAAEIWPRPMRYQPLCLFCWARAMAPSGAAPDFGVGSPSPSRWATSMAMAARSGHRQYRSAPPCPSCWARAMAPSARPGLCGGGGSSLRHGG